MQHMRLSLEGRNNDESESVTEKSSVKIDTDEKHATAVGPDDEKLNLDDTNAKGHEGKDLESEKDGSLIDAGPDEPNSDGFGEVSASGNNDWEYITGWKLLVVIVTICMAAFIIWLDTSIVSTAIPRITSEFHSLGDIGWYGSAYLLGNATCQPLSGKMYANLSSKFVFLGFLVTFELGSLLCGIATSSKMLIVGRAVAGIGSSGIMNGSLVIVTACVPRHKAPIYIGICFSFGQLALSFGPLIGGALTEYTIWRWCFYINLPIGGLVAVVLLLIHIPDRSIKPATRRTIRSTFQELDISGFLILAPTTVMLLLAIEWGGNTYPWHSAKIIGLLCGSAVTCTLFVAWESRRGTAAMIPLTMVRNRVIAMSCITNFFFMGSMLITTYYMAVYFQAVRGATPTEGGIHFLPSVLNQMVFVLLSSGIITRVGYYLPFAVIGNIMNSIGTGLLCLLKPNSTTAQWIGYQILGGIGRGCAVQTTILSAQNAVSESESAIAITFVVFTSLFGGVIWLSFAQTTLNNGLSAALPKYAPDLSSKEIASLGATSFRAVLPEAVIPGVIMAYNEAVVRVFYLAAACAVAAFVFSFGIGWKSVRKVKVAGPVDGA